MLLHLNQNNCKHLNSVTHEGKVIVVATDTDGGLWYTGKQDGFEDSYLNTPESQRTGWENWQALTFPNEADDASVLQKERAELTYEEDSSKFILRSRYRTQNLTAVAPVQLVSALGHIYVFRQSKGNTLLVDRFVLDGMTNRLNRKLDVRFKRSRQKYQPSQNMRKGSNGLENIDSLDFRDANNNYFYEPTTELCLISNLKQGWFSVVLVPTVEHDVHRWHIFAYNQGTEKVELTTIRASQEGLFDVKDYTYFEESNETLVPQRIPGVIKRSLNIAEATVTNGLAATKYDLQEAGVTQSGEEQLQRTATRIMLAIPTDGGTAVFSFAIAGDGTLSKISESPKVPNNFPKQPLLRGQQREVLLPLNTLDEIRAYGDRTPSPKGLITGMSEGTEEDGEGLVKITTGEQAAELQRGDLVKITDTRNYQGLYRVVKISNDIFEIDLPGEGLGYWEKEELETGGLTFDGMITAYRKNGNGKLQVTCPNHGLESDENVQIKGTEDCNQTYMVRKVDATDFVVEHQWTGGEAINVKLLSQKRRGLVFDGVGDYVEIAYNAQLNPNSFSVSCWVKVEGKQGTERSLISCVDDTGGITRGYRIVANAQNQWSLQVGGESGWQAITGPDIQLNTWTHICGTYNSTNNGVNDAIGLNLYVNGVLVVPPGNLRTGYASNTSRSLRIGATTGTPTSFFRGRIADVQIWNIARSASDIADTRYLQLAGKEVGLVGYWRLGAIAEGKVTDFSVNCNHGSVHGDPYVSAATLERTLADRTTQVVKYTNPELFAVTKHATYEESFEFKVNSSRSVDLDYLNNADSRGNKIFTLSYWGKSNRSAEEEKPIVEPHIQQREFENLGNGWFKASCEITVPSGISLLRSFEIDDVEGSWDSLEIRKHRIRLLSDSITQETYEDTVLLETKGNAQTELRGKLQQLAMSEQRLASLALQKRKLDHEIVLLSNTAQLDLNISSKATEVSDTSAEITRLTNEVNAKQQQINAVFSLTVGFNKHENHNHHLQSVKIGRYKEADYAWIREGISSLVVPGGLKVTLWSGKNFDGDRYDITGYSAAQKLYHFNDRTQSISVEGTNGIVDLDAELRHRDNLSETLRLKQVSLPILEKELSDLRALKLNATSQLASKRILRDRVQTEIGTVQTRLISSNNELKNFLSSSETYDMPEIATDVKGLVTMGARLNFVNPVSRLHAIETCEGNVQLSYFDAQGRMQQTSYDATSDSHNTSSEQWTANTERTCLNLSASNSIAQLKSSLNPPAWTLEAQFFYPLPDGANIRRNTLVSGQSCGHSHRESMKFDGVDDHITLPSLNHDFSRGITIEAWVWYDSFKPWSRIIDFGSGQDSDNILFFAATASANATRSDLMFSVYKGSSRQNVIAIGVLEIGKWMHLTATIDASGNAKLYKNGIQVQSGSVNLPNKLNRNNNFIGKSNWSGDGYFHGKIRDLRIWNKARSEAEIRADMMKRLTGGESNLVNYWQLNRIATSGSSTVQVADLSVSGKNGTVTGAIVDTEVDAHDVVVERDGTLDRLGANIAGFGFIDSGYLMNQLSPGWHHINVVAQAETDQPTTTFYIDGEKVGELKTGAISTIAAIGNSNSEQKGCPFGKLAEVRIWEIALSQNEVAINSKTLLSGNEPGLLAYYPMTEAQGATIRDRTGSGNDGTISGGGNENTVDQHWWGCTALMGHSGTTVMRFDGQDDYIEVPFNQKLNPSQFTISGWAKVTGGQGTYRSLLTSRSSNNSVSQGYVLYAGENNKWQAWVGNSDWVSVTGPDVELNVWTHVCATYDGSKLTLYINGIKSDEKATGYTPNSNRPLRIGAGTTETTPSFFLSGRISEVCIWDRACTQAEIQQGMHVPLTGKEPNLVGYYPLNYVRSEGTAQIALNLAIPDALLFGATTVADETLPFSKPKVMQFDGRDDYIELDDTTHVTRNFTQELWIYPTLTDNSYHGVLGNHPSAGNNHRAPSIWIYEKNRICASFGNAGRCFELRTDPGALVSNAWNHVAVTYNGQECIIYVDGQLSKREAISFDSLANTPIRYIGKVDNWFQGKVSEVRIWDKCRTQQEIKVDMKQPLTGNEQNLIAYYPLDDVKSEGANQKVLNLVGGASSTRKGTVSGATEVEDFGLPLTRIQDAVISEEYSTIALEPETERKVAIMRRFFAYPIMSGAVLLPDKRVEALELRWIGNAQFAPTLLGYIEGPPPVPSENLTLSDDYNKATSVELTMSEDVAFKWNRSQDVGGGASTELFLGAETEVTVLAGPFVKGIAKKRLGFKGNFESKSQEKRETSITASSSLAMTDKLELRGTTEQKAKFEHLGKRFVPKNVGYALVVSALADVFVTCLARSGKMVSYLVQPVDGIDPDINTITFLINPAYTMNGSLDGLTGSSATSERFFRHVPEMRAQYGSLYPASYYRLKEAYNLKQQIEREDKRRASYFSNFDVRGVDELSLERSIDSGGNAASIGVQREEDKADTTTSAQDRQDAATVKTQQLQRETEDAAATTGKAAEAKQAQIQTEIDNREKRAHATTSFAKWQERMDDILGKAGKRNIANTYVWDADGGLRTEAQSFASTIEHSVGSSFEMSAALGFEGQFGLSVFRKELTTQATVNLTQTMTKTETRSKGFQLNISLDGLEARGITDHNDNPIVPGAKVDRYRFMSFYLEGSTQNFQDFFNYVVDPEWLASNDEEARALREARSKPNKTWRVLHRVTYVERPALMGFGRDVRQLPKPTEESEIAQLKAEFKEMKEQNQEIANQLDNILQLLQDRNSESTAT